MYHRKVTWIWLLSVAVVLYFNGDNSRGDAFNVADYTHYLDYLPYRQQGFASFEGFLTSQKPPIALRDRKMDLGPLKLDVDEVLGKAVWPKRWPYSSEDFRPLDYSYDDVINTGATYQLTQSMIMANKAAIFPGVSLPIKRHFIFPKDKVALAEHLKEDVCDEAKVLELFSCYESILPGGVELGPTVG